MSRFLLIPCTYPPVPDPSGRIVYLLAKELLSAGHTVDILTVSTEGDHVTKGENGETIHWIYGGSWYNLCQFRRSHPGNKSVEMKFKIYGLARKVYLATQIQYFPDSEPRTTKHMVQYYQKHLKNNKYDCVIGFFRPFSSFSAAIEIGKKADIKTMCCYLDLVEITSCPSLMPRKLYWNLIQRGDNLVFEKSDAVLLPMAAKRAENSLYKKFQDKIIYFEFPTFLGCNKENEIYEAEKKDNVINFMFAGRMNMGLREPGKLLQLMNAAAEKNPDQIYRLHFFGSGCRDMIQSWVCQKNLEIADHGMVSKEIVDREQLKMDFLINITNQRNTMVPSKIFELFASRMPIINVISAEDDGSEIYFDRYPLCSQHEWKNSDELSLSAEKLNRFVSEQIGKYADADTVCNAFYRCTPKYMAGQIVSSLE